jgi:hypothetical protein
LQVSKALNEEIWRLSNLVDEFNLPFHTDQLVLNVYKKEINAHVELGLGSNLRARLSTALAMNVETAQREMTGRLLPNQTLYFEEKPTIFLFTFRSNDGPYSTRKDSRSHQSCHYTYTTLRNAVLVELSKPLCRFSRRPGLSFFMGHYSDDTTFHGPSERQESHNFPTTKQSNECGLEIFKFKFDRLRRISFFFG